MPGAFAFVLKGYPRLSETFIAQEIQALEQRGLVIRIISLRQPTDGHVHPIHREIRAPVTYLPEYLFREPARVWRCWRAVRRLTGFPLALRTWRRDFLRDPTPSRVRRFGQAVVLAQELPRDVRQLHAHFLHTPASVARYTSLLTGLPWSCSAHARDIWTSPDWEKKEKLRSCRWTVTCTAINCTHLKLLAPEPERVELMYHGLDLARFPRLELMRPKRDGGTVDDPVIILSVGRAVEKKGYDDLLDALARLPPVLNWRFVHIGGGPLLPRLKKRAGKRGIAQRISWLGAQPHHEVLRRYIESDLFVLACRVAGDGDRDGLPNVLMEAQSQALPCLSTRVSAIPELLEDGLTGLLVAQRDSAALASALERLIVDPALRTRLGEAGNGRVRENFSLEVGADRLMSKFDPAYRPSGEETPVSAVLNSGNFQEVNA